MHENEAHYFRATAHFFSKACIKPYQPPSSPNVAPNYFWLFQKKKKSPFLSRDENLRPIMIFVKNEAQIPKGTHKDETANWYPHYSAAPLEKGSALAWRSFSMEPNSGWMGTFCTW